MIQGKCRVGELRGGRLRRADELAASCRKRHGSSDALVASSSVSAAQQCNNVAEVRAEHSIRSIRMLRPKKLGSGYKDQKGWGHIFARVVVGFLAQERETFRQFPVIVASPTYVGPDGRTWDHTRWVLQCGHVLAEGVWPFDMEEAAVVVKTAATDPMRGKKRKERHAIAIGPLRAAVRVPQPARTRGKRILVYDDVFTDGQCSTKSPTVCDSGAERPRSGA